LEKLQSEIRERILKLAPIIGLHLPSFKARTVIQKLHFLDKLLESEWTGLAPKHCLLILLADGSLKNWALGGFLQKCLSDLTASDTDKEFQNIILIMKQDWSQTVTRIRNPYNTSLTCCWQLV